MFQTLGKFEIKKRLGHGAMGEVYLGLDPFIGREVAIKTIHPHAAQADGAKQRFAREAQAAGKLNHPNLVTIHEFGEDQGVLYIVMEYVRGYDLEELFREQALTRTEILEVLAQVCDGLAYAHSNGIVHRDIKPANVRVMKDGPRLHAKVMDFGVARLSNSEMTATGMIMGTVSYMAPEYISTGEPDPRSDLFAVGVMLYEALSGRKPFAGDTTPSILYRIVHQAPEPIDLSKLEGMSPAIRSVLDRALEKSPEQRHQTAEELAQVLRAAKDPTWQGQAPDNTVRMPHGVPPLGTEAPSTPQPRKRSRGFVLGLVGLGAFLALGAYAALRYPDSPFARKRELLPPAGTSLAEPPALRPQPAGQDAPSTGPGTSKASPPVAEKRDVLPPRASLDSEKLRAAPERTSLDQLKEAIALVDTNPEQALEGLRNAMEANPTDVRAYAWTVAILYEQGRYKEIRPILAKARQQGIRHGQMMGIMRFRMAMQSEALNRRIPGGLQGSDDHH